MLTAEERPKVAASERARPKRRATRALGAVPLVLGAALLAVAPRLGAPTRISAVGLDTPATAMDEAIGPGNNSPELVADPGSSRFVVLANRVDGPDFSCALQLSGDGGATWVPADPVHTLPKGVEKCYAPEAAFDRTGRLYYLFVGLAGTGNKPVGAFLTSSVDHGRSFAPPRRVLGPDNFSVRMAIDRGIGRSGRIHLVWLHAAEPPGAGFGAGPNPILAAHSDDGGATFSRPVTVSDPGRAMAVAPALVLGAHHALHVAYYDLGTDARDYQGVEGPTWDGQWSVVWATSPDGGRHFGRGVVVDDAVVPVERVMLVFTMPPPAIAARGKLACAAWTDGRHGDADALARCSHDGGRHWDAVRRLNDDKVGTGARQYLPRLDIAPGGRLDAVFLDRRADPYNTLNDTFYTFSTDGGRHFAANRRLDGTPSNSRKGAQYAGVAANGLTEFGGRLGLLSRSRSVVAAWPDTRNSNGHGQDVFVAGVDLAAGTSPRWALVAGSVLLAAGLAVVLGRRRRPPTIDQGGPHA